MGTMKEASEDGEKDAFENLLLKYRNSKVAEQQQLCAVISVMGEVILEQGLKKTSTSYFAAMMTSLESTHTQSNGPVTAAICTLLSMILPKTPVGVLKSKMDGSLAVLMAVVGKQARDTADDGAGSTQATKAALVCIQQLLSAADKSSWPNIARPFSLLLQHCIHPKPKLRKRAQASLADALHSFRKTPSSAPASDMVAKMAEQLFQAALQQPAEVADRQAVEGTGTKKQKREAHEHAQAATSKAATSALHMLGALAMAIPLMSGKAVARLTKKLADLYEIRHPLLMWHVTEVLLALVSSPESEVSAEALAEILRRILSQEGTDQKRDVDSLMATARLIQRAFERLNELDSNMCATLLPHAFHTLTVNMQSEQEAVIYGSAECLRGLVNTCISDSMIQQGKEHTGKDAPTPIKRICVAMEATLGYQYSTAWDIALLVLAALFQRLGPASASLLADGVRSLGDLQDLPDSDMKCRKQLHVALGAAVAAMGPEAFLSLLPLQFTTSDLSTSRVWLLPILRQHIVGARLAYFATHVHPLIKALQQRATKSKDVEGKPVAAKNVEACAQQVWALLPALCNFPSDTAQSFKLIARVLGETLSSNKDLDRQVHGIVMHTLKTLINQNKRAKGLSTKRVAAVGNGNEEEEDGKQEEDEGEDEEGEEEEGRELSTAETRARELYTADVAEANLKAIAAFARQFLPILFNLFVANPPEKRNGIQMTIEAYASIADSAVLKSFFGAVMQKLLQATKDAAAADGSGEAMATDEDPNSTPTTRRCTFMDLALSLAAGLDEDGARTLYVTTKPALLDTDPQVQKKAYKLLAHLFEVHPDFSTSRVDESLELLLAAMPACHSSAKRVRLLCLKFVVLRLLSHGDPKSENAVAALVSEVVLATKEVNKKTRNLAYGLLVDIGRGMQELAPDDTARAVLRFFTMVMGGLAGTTPHMMSATVVALARLLYEFTAELMHTVPELLPSVLLLLRSKSREVIKSVLGLVKVVVLRLSAQDLEPHLKSLVEGLLLWSDDSKNHFKTKVRVLMERLVRRCGQIALEKVIPPSHARLLTHIRKTRERGQRKKRAARGEVEGADDDAKSARSRASTARKSAWNHTEVFSDDDDDDMSGFGSGEDVDDLATTSGRSAARTKGTDTHARSSAGAGSSAVGGARSFRSSGGASLSKSRALRLRFPGDVGEDPLDLLDNDATRRSMTAGGKSFGKKRDREEDEIEYDLDGRIVVRAEGDKAAMGAKRKREREGGMEEDDEEGEDMDGDGTGSVGGRSSGGGTSIRSGGGRKERRRGEMQKSPGGGRGGGRDRDRDRDSQKKGGGSWAYTGNEYKAKKGRSSGDVKRDGKLEPYAYWPLDPKMLNRREGKKAQARKGMNSATHFGKKGRRGQQQTSTGLSKGMSKVLDGGIRKKSAIRQKSHKKGKGKKV